MHKGSIVTIFLFTFFIHSSLLAQQYHFKVYATDKGLPQSEVRSMFKDSRDNLWMGTQSGAARYNGKEFHTISEKDGMKGQVIWEIMEDNKGNIWFGTENGLNCYNGKTIKSYAKTNYTYFGKIWQDKQGGIWVNATYQNRFTHILQIRHDSLVNFTAQHKDIFFKNQNRLFGQTYKAKQGNLYINTLQGLYEYDGKKIFRSPLGNIKAFKSPFRIRVIFIDRRGFTWVIQAASNARSAPKLYKCKDGAAKEVKFPANFPLGGINTNKVFEDNTGNVWFVSGTFGALCYSGTGKTQVFNNSNGLPANDISCVAQDREGNVWLGTANTGYGVLKYSGARFVLYDKRDGLDVEVNWAILEDSQKRLWGGFTRQAAQYKNGKFEVYELLKNQPRRVNFIEELSDKTVLLGTTQNLYEFDGQDFVPVTRKYNLPAPPVKCFQQNDTLWMGLTNSTIVKVYDKKVIEDSSWRRFPVVGGLTHITRDKKGIFWISTGAGLYRYDGRNAKLFNEANSNLIGDFVCQTVVDARNRLWVGSIKGVQILEHGKIRNIQAKLPSNMTYSLVIDAKQNVWVGHQLGLSKIITDEKGEIKTVKNYSKEEGMLIGEPNIGASYANKGSKVWFGGVKGITEYNEKADTGRVVAPKVNITQAKLFLKPVAWDSATYAAYHKGLPSWSLLPRQLRLPYNKNSISFDFEALCYHAADSVFFKWKLEGLGNEWSPITTNREAAYTNLPPGKYTFWVKTRNIEGIWSTPQSYSFEILAPFWVKWWFRSLVLLLILGLIYLVFRARVRHIERQKKKLEVLVDEKTTEVVKQRDEILEKNEELTQRTEEIAAQAECLRVANEEISRKNEDITASISYAERIQSAILPQTDHIRKELPESFIFFKPRDIVSDDFYWFTATEKHIVFAAVDCTGHGVPGAFMSLIGNDLLSQVVKVQNHWQPDIILNELHIQVRKALKQAHTNNRDGMDISVVVINKTSQTLHFAGAKGTLIYFQENVLHKIKGDKMPVGGEQREDVRRFTAHKVDLSTPTTFYLFSDGFQDQFGGTKGKKFMVTQFRQLLEDIHNKPMSAQHQLLESTLNDWMTPNGQTYKQLDDILVIGVKA